MQKNHLKPKSHTHKEIFVWLLKYYTIEDFNETMKGIDFPDLLKCICVNAVYSDFINKFLIATDPDTPTKKVLVKTNSRCWFDTEII